MFKNKKGATDAWGKLLVVAVIVTMVYMIKPDALSFAGIESPATTKDIMEGTCSDPSNSVTWGDVSKKWSPTTTISAGAGTSVRYYLNGGTGTATTSGSTKTLNFGDTITGLYSYGSSADTTYYAQKFSFKMPCGPVETKTNTDTELLANGSVTWENFNVDTGNKNTGAGADNETINAADTGKFNLRISTLDKTGISTPGGKYMLVAEFNKSMYDESSVTLGGKSGVSVPQSYTLANTDSYIIGWEFPACPTGDSRSCGEDLGQLSITADSGENPTGAGTSDSTAIGLGDIKLTILDQSYGVNTITDEIIGPAYVDNEGTAIGLFGSTGQPAYLSVD